MAGGSYRESPFGPGSREPAHHDKREGRNHGQTLLLQLRLRDLRPRGMAAWQWMGIPLVPQCANHPSLPGRLQDVTGTACCNYRPKPVLPHGDSLRLIPLGDGCYAYVDAADYEWLSRYMWRFENGYAARQEKGRRLYMHRQITQAPKGMVVDHIDANRVNNCRFNLRVCTPEKNHRNQRKRRDSHSRFKGVFYDRRQR